MNNQTAYCIECNCKQPYSISSTEVTTEVEGIQFSYVMKQAFCAICESPMYIPEINDENVRAQEAAYYQKAIDISKNGRPKVKLASERLSDFINNVAPLNPLQVSVNDRIYTVTFSDSWVKDGDFLIGEYGTGSTFEDACYDYINKISGKNLVFNPAGEREKRICVIVL